MAYPFGSYALIHYVCIPPPTPTTLIMMIDFSNRAPAATLVLSHGTSEYCSHVSFDGLQDEVYLRQNTLCLYTAAYRTHVAYNLPHVRHEGVL